jgi:hypothetical protein
VAAGLALTHAANLEIDWSWRSVGLRGTGTYALLAEDLLIPEAFSVVGPVTANPGPPPAKVTPGAIMADLTPR